MSKLFQNKYLDIGLWFIFSLIGIFLYEWKITQVLFFVYLHHLLKIPGIFIVAYRVNKKKIKETGAFAFLFSLIFSAYTLFFMILMYTYRSNRFDDSWLNAFLEPSKDLFENFELPLLGLFLIEFLNYIYKHRHVEANIENANKLFIRVCFQYAIFIVPLIICGVLNSNEFKLDRGTIAFSVLIIFGLTEVLNARSKRGNFIQKNN